MRKETQSNSHPILSVCLITYNQAKFIRQAIDGVLMQKTNFPFQLVVADDVSSDGTREILQEYKEKHPDKIHLILQEKNKGPAQNWIDLVTYPKSKYISYFEGDDYFIDENKFQKQIDFLESHPEYSACTHYGDIIHEDGSLKKKSKRPMMNEKNERHFEHALRQGASSWVTASVIFKREYLERDIFWTLFDSDKFNGDFILDLVCAEDKPIYYMEDNMAVHRHHPQGVWSGINRKKKTFRVDMSIVGYFYLDKVMNLDKKHRGILASYLKRNLIRRFKLSKGEGNRYSAKYLSMLLTYLFKYSYLSKDKTK